MPPPAGRLFDRLRRPLARPSVTTPATPSLPPGDLVALEELEKVDRAALLRRSHELGPIFKGVAWGEPCVCIVGLALGRRFLQEHAESLRVFTMELDPLIPKGFLCQMEGADHLHYRKATSRALRVDEATASADAEALLVIAQEGLRAYQSSQSVLGGDPGADSVRFTDTCSRIATSMLTRQFLGSAPGTDLHERWMQRFYDMGPHGLVWNPQQRQRDAYRAFRDDVAAEVTAIRDGRVAVSPTSMLARCIDADALDETMLGNLIYRAEMGRSDIKNLLRWLTRHATDDAMHLERIAEEERARTGRYSEAFVLETLRTDQSERLERRTRTDLTFEGFRIPAGTAVRICLWESHHDPASFDDPHRFDPARFLGVTPSGDRFAPFGLDHHQCPMGTMSIQVGTAFVRALAGYSVRAVTPGRPMRGGYHWEPSPRFAVELSSR